MWPYRTCSDLCQTEGPRGGQPAPHPRMGAHRPGVSQELVRSVLVRVRPDLGGLCSGSRSVSWEECAVSFGVQRLEAHQLFPRYKHGVSRRSGKVARLLRVHAKRQRVLKYCLSLCLRRPARF